MPESSLNDVLLPALRGEDVGDAEARLLEADPSGAEAALLHLVRIAAVEASATSVAVDDLLAWADGADDVEVEALVGRSGLAAEQLEAALDEAGVGGSERLAAASGAPGDEPWPTTYSGGPWELMVGLDEADRLFLARLAGPDGSALLAGLEPIPLPPLGDAVVLGAAEEVLGAPAEFNPWPTMGVTSASGTTTLEPVS